MRGFSYQVRCAPYWKQQYCWKHTSSMTLSENVVVLFLLMPLLCNNIICSQVFIKDISGLLLLLLGEKTIRIPPRFIFRIIRTRFRNACIRINDRGRDFINSFIYTALDYIGSNYGEGSKCRPFSLSFKITKVCGILSIVTIVQSYSKSVRKLFM